MRRQRAKQATGGCELRAALAAGALPRTAIARSSLSSSPEAAAMQQGGTEEPLAPPQWLYK